MTRPDAVRSSDDEPPGRRHVLDIAPFTQPDDVSCGPTCLRGVLDYYGDSRSLEEVMAHTRRNPDGGTLAVYLGLAALSMGLHATLYPFSVRVFDLTWRTLEKEALIQKLLLRAMVDDYLKLRVETLAWADLLREGGRVRFRELSARLLMEILDRGHPILCGLSATHLYRSARERPHDNVPDDVWGRGAGHFVVVGGYSAGGRNFHVWDPVRTSPSVDARRYVVPATRLLNSILLGDATGDAVLLEIGRRPHGRPRR